MKLLKALLVEDSNDDAALLLRHLFNEGFEVQSTIVQTAANMKAGLAEQSWDIILSDYTMPHFTGLDALAILKESDLDIPFIIISGTIGEEIAVNAMLNGVDDYLMKGNLTRLAPAIKRELKNAAKRQKQKQAEEDLRLSETSLANAQRLAHIGSWDNDLKNNRLRWSEEIYRIFGVAKADFGDTLESFVSFIHPEDRQRVQAAADAAMSKTAPYNIEHRIIRPDGEVRFVCEIGEVKFDESGNPLHFIGTVQDITERKLTDDALEKAVKRERAMIDNSLDVICTIDAEGNFASISPACLKIWGYSPEELTGRKYIDLVVPEDVPKTNEAALRVVSDERLTDFENRYRHKNGTTANMLWAIFWSDAEQLLFCVGHDITKRKQAEEALKLSEARFNQLVESSIIGIIITNLNGSIIEANDVFLKTVGYSREDLLAGKLRWDEMTPPEILWQDDRARKQLKDVGYSSPREKEYIRKDGSRIPVMVGGTLLKGGENTVLAFVLDITERKRAEQLIIESEERYRFLFDNSPLPKWVFDLETFAFLSVNDAAIAHYGYSREEFLTMTVKDIRPPEDVPFFLETIGKDAPGIRNAGVYRHIKKDGTVIYVEINTNQVIFNGKKAKLVLANDVTERLKAEESVRFQAHLLNTVEQAVIATDLNGIVTFWNQYAEKLYGWTNAEAVGRFVMELTTPEIKTEQANRIMARLSEGTSWAGEFVVQNKDGETFPAYISNSLVNDDKGKIVGFVGVSVDITERKRAEQIITESEEKYRSIVETANEGILMNDIEGRTVFVNRQMPEMLGYTVDDLMGRTIFDFIFEEDLEVAKQKIERRKLGIAETSELRLRRKDGSEIIFLHKSSPTRNEAGEITGFLTMNTDITERKKAERELRNAEAQYRSLVESSPAIVYLAEPHPPYSPIYVSPNITRFGYTAEEWFDRPDMWVSIIHDEDRARVLRATENAVAQGEETDMEYRVVSKDGAIVWLHDKGSFVLDEQGNKTGWQGMMIEITKTKELEEQLRQSQKLESVGMLAGGIAHDFNNMLTAINGYSELTLRRLDQDSPLRRNIEEIKKAGQRSAELTYQLLAFSRQQVLRSVVLDINEVLNDTIKMLQRVIGEDVELTTALNPKVGRVKADPGQLTQVIMNLAVNARDAMPQGGKLTVETSNIFLDPVYTRQRIGVLPGAYVMLSVTDTGSGMSPETKRRLFDPFFTTKKVGEGTGLGLATVYGIIKQSGGNIEVYSEQGFGTTFKIYLPRVSEAAATEKISHIAAEMPKGTERILLVEDEKLVRQLSREILEECGYTVHEAADGFEALKICEQNDYKFDLLMTDVVMPKMGGRELAEKLTARLPDLRILFTSGYTDDAVVRHGVIEVGTNFIQKPFTPGSLTKKVRELLGV